MAYTPTDWDAEEFKAYVLLYCSTADFELNNRERNIIKSKIGGRSFREIHKEFEKDSPTVRMDKIRTAAERFRYSEQPTRLMIADIMALFVSDGSYNTQEKELLNKLKTLLR